MHSPKEKAGLSDWLAVAGAILGAFTAILDIQITAMMIAIACQSDSMNSPMAVLTTTG